ncbi:MAG: hypothetical protein II222_02725, partial [Paraprevotella sp.]|nr:hypothetical protein [Paraprevotella sp.]
MATIISLKKEEKLAILKVMIETNNHYSNKGLPKAFEFIQDTANYFRLSSNDISEVYSLDSNDIKNILKESFGKSLDKESFFKQLMNYMLIVGQNVDYRNGRKRWGYINLLTDGCLSSNFIFTYATNPLKDFDWYLIHDEQSCQKLTTQLGSINHSTRLSVEQLDPSIIFQPNPNERNDQHSNNKIAKYTDATKEKLAILRFLFELNNRFALSKGSEFIQDTANYLGITRIKKKAHLMTLDDAKNILGKALEYDFDKGKFVRDLFDYYLKNPELGTNAQKKLFKEAATIIGRNIYSYYSGTTENPLTNSDFRLIKKDDINTFTIRYNVKDLDNSLPEERTLRTEPPKTKSQPIVRNEPVISNK